MELLKNKIALVTGASRGIGKGIAIALAKYGATVYITGRSVSTNSNNNKLVGSINDTEAYILSFGGKCTAIRCDHTNDEEVSIVFNQIFEIHNKLDILVNNAWG